MDRISMALEFLKRLQAESPDFFKKIQRFSWLVFAAAGAAWLAKAFGLYALPEEVSELLKGLVYFFAGSAVTAKLPVENKKAAGIPDEPPPGEGLVGGRPDDRKP